MTNRDKQNIAPNHTAEAVQAEGMRSQKERKFRAISSARLWRRRLYTCALSTSSSLTTLKKELSSCGGLRA